MRIVIAVTRYLALSFSALKAFHQAPPMLVNLLAPLGERTKDVACSIVQSIYKSNIGLLSTLGLALLAYTAISLMQKVKESLNLSGTFPAHGYLASDLVAISACSWLPRFWCSRHWALPRL